MRSFLFGSVVALGCLGCAGRFESGSVPTGLASFALAAASTSHSAAKKPPADRHVALEYELGGRPFPSPLVHATVGGHSTWLVMDTGTSYHAMSGWLAGELALPLASENFGKDHVGRAIHVGVIEDASISAGDWGMLVDEPLLVADVPEAFHELNLGGFLSPQFLAKDDDRVLLDLAGAELSVVSSDAAEKALASRGGRFPLKSKVCRASDAVPYRTFVVPAYIDREPVNLLVDTGAERTNLRASSIAGAKLLSRAKGDPQRVYGAGGAFMALSIPDARVQLGEIGITLDIGLVPGIANSDCPSDGVLGMDLLRSCVLSLGEGPIDGRCQTRDETDDGDD